MSLARPPEAGKVVPGGQVGQECPQWPDRTCSPLWGKAPPTCPVIYGTRL